MPRATVTSRGQTVIPKPIRDYLGLQPGDSVDFVVQDGGEVLVRPATEDVRGLKGMLQIAGRKPVSVGTMQAAVRRRAGGA